MVHVADRGSFKRATTQGRDMPGSSAGFLQDSLWEFEDHRRLGDVDDRWSPCSAPVSSTWQRDDRGLQQGGPAAGLPSANVTDKGGRA
jgi:hypothetical protein